MNIQDLLTSNPNATDAEIATLASSVRIVERVVTYGDLASILGSAVSAAAIGVQVQRMSSPAAHPGTPDEQAVAARMFRQVDNDLSSVGINLGAAVTREQIQAIATAMPNTPIAQAAPALLAAAEVRTVVTAEQVAAVRKQIARDALANRLARLSSLVLDAFDANVEINVPAAWETMQ